MRKFKTFTLFLLVFFLATTTACAYNVVRFGPGYYPKNSSGKPISLGYIYVGEEDLDPEIVANQKTLYVQQEDGSIVAVSQPLRTSAGGVPTYSGSPVTLLVSGNYSLKILDSSGTQVYYVPSVLSDTSLAITNRYYLSNYDDLADAVTDLGTTVCTLIIDTDSTISTNVTTPETMYLEWPTPDNILTVAATKVLTVYSPDHLKVPRDQQIKDGDGTLAFTECGVVTPDLFGALRDGTSDDSTYISEATATGCTVELLSGEYKTTAYITLNNSGQVLMGAGEILFDPLIPGTSCIIVSESNVSIKDISVTGPHGAEADYGAGDGDVGIEMNNGSSLCNVSNVSIKYFDINYSDNGAQNSFEYNTCTDYGTYGAYLLGLLSSRVEYNTFQVTLTNAAQYHIYVGSTHVMFNTNLENNIFSTGYNGVRLYGGQTSLDNCTFLNSNSGGGVELTINGAATLGSSASIHNCRMDGDIVGALTAGGTFVVDIHETTLNDPSITNGEGLMWMIGWVMNGDTGEQLAESDFTFGSTKGIVKFYARREASYVFKVTGSVAGSVFTIALEEPGADSNTGGYGHHSSFTAQTLNTGTTLTVSPSTDEGTFTITTNGAGSSLIIEFPWSVIAIKNVYCVYDTDTNASQVRAIMYPVNSGKVQAFVHTGTGIMNWDDIVATKIVSFVIEVVMLLEHI